MTICAEEDWNTWQFLPPVPTPILCRISENVSTIVFPEPCTSPWIKRNTCLPCAFVSVETRLIKSLIVPMSQEVPGSEWV